MHLVKDLLRNVVAGEDSIAANMTLMETSLSRAETCSSASTKLHPCACHQEQKPGGAMHCRRMVAGPDGMGWNWQWLCHPPASSNHALRVKQSAWH